MWAREIGGYAALASRLHEEHKEVLTDTLKVSPEIPEVFATWGATLTDSDIAAIILQPGIKLLSPWVQTQIQVMKLAMNRKGVRRRQDTDFVREEAAVWAV